MYRLAAFFNTNPQTYPANYGTYANAPGRARHSPAIYGLYGPAMQQHFNASRSMNRSRSSRLNSIPMPWSSPATTGFFNGSGMSSRLSSISVPWTSPRTSGRFNGSSWVSGSRGSSWTTGLWNVSGGSAWSSNASLGGRWY